MKLSLRYKAFLTLTLLFLPPSCVEQKDDASLSKLQSKVITSTVSFIAVGDIMLSRGVARKIAAAKNPLLPFSKFAGQLKSADFNFANLESPFSGSDRLPPSGSLVFNAPDENIAGLIEYNFKVVSIANNHILDQGLKGLIYTRDFLQEKGILAVGAGQSLDEAWQPRIYKVKNIKIGFIAASYASINDGGVFKNDYVARIEDLDRLKKAVQELDLEADLIVVSMHAGKEDTFKVDDSQRSFARSAIEAGADLVIGHHPHWIQPVEVYKGKFIFYSLGNFIFDQRNENNREGLAIKVVVQKRKIDEPNSKSVTRVKCVELIPVIIENFSTPREASSEESRKILAKIGIDKRMHCLKKADPMSSRSECCSVN